MFHVSWPRQPATEMTLPSSNPSADCGSADSGLLSPLSVLRQAFGWLQQFEQRHSYVMGADLRRDLLQACSSADNCSSPGRLICTGARSCAAARWTCCRLVYADMLPSRTERQKPLWTCLPLPCIVVYDKNNGHGLPCPVRDQTEVNSEKEDRDEYE